MALTHCATTCSIVSTAISHFPGSFSRRPGLSLCALREPSAQTCFNVQLYCRKQLDKAENHDYQSRENEIGRSALLISVFGHNGAAGAGGSLRPRYSSVRSPVRGTAGLCVLVPLSCTVAILPRPPVVQPVCPNAVPTAFYGVCRTDRKNRPVPKPLS